MPKIFTVIVTYNGEQWIDKAIQALLHSSQESEILVIDNASTDSTVKILQHYPGVTILHQQQNLGFGGASNIGMRIAMENNADHVFLLNQDAYVAENTIEKLTEAQQKFPEFGVLSPLQLAPGNRRFDRAFGIYVNRIISGHDAREFLDTLSGNEVFKPIPIRFVNAAAWMISAECLQKVGYFHSVFYHYGEDNNYASRTAFHGFKVGILAGTAIIHDRNQEPPAGLKETIRKLQTIPLYTLLDIRKPFWLAYWLGKRKLQGITKKLNHAQTVELGYTIEEMRAWFSNRKQEAIIIRSDMKRALPVQGGIPLNLK